MICKTHVWRIASLHAWTRHDGHGMDEPREITAVLCCCRCPRETDHLSLQQVQDMIRAGAINNASLAQWASVAPLFAV